MTWFDSLNPPKKIIKDGRLALELYRGDMKDAADKFGDLPQTIENLMKWALNVSRPGGQKGCREIGAAIVLQTAGIYAEDEEGNPVMVGDYEIEIRRIR